MFVPGGGLQQKQCFRAARPVLGGCLLCLALVLSGRFVSPNLSLQSVKEVTEVALRDT